MLWTVNIISLEHVRNLGKFDNLLLLSSFLFLFGAISLNPEQANHARIESIGIFYLTHGRPT